MPVSPEDRYATHRAAVVDLMKQSIELRKGLTRTGVDADTADLLRWMADIDKRLGMMLATIHRGFTGLPAPIPTPRPIEHTETLSELPTKSVVVDKDGDAWQALQTYDPAHGIHTERWVLASSDRGDLVTSVELFGYGPIHLVYTPGEE